MTSLIVRTVAAALGVVLIYGAAFLYEDDERRVQNRLESLWVELHSVSTTVMSRHLAFVNAATQFVDRWLSRIYGERLLSRRAAAMSYLLQFLAFQLAVAAAMPLLWKYFWTYFGIHEATVQLVNLGLWCLVTGFIGWAIRRGVRQPGGRAPEVAAIVLLLLNLAGALAVSALGMQRGLPAPTRGLVMAAMLVGATVSIGIDIAAVAALRALIRAAARRGTLGAYLGLLTGVFGIMAMVLGLPVAVFLVGPRYHLPPIAGGVAGVALVGMISTLIPPGLLAALLVTLVLHRLVWPAILRPLYAVHRHKLLFGHPKAALSVGIYLVLAAWRPGLLSPQALLPAILERFNIQVPSSTQPRR
jgi:hypothetical protein